MPCTAQQQWWHRFVSSTLAQILVQSHFELVSLVLALEATELVSEPVNQTDKHSSHFSTAVKTNFEMMMKCC